jgi:hypothetical protein
VVELTRPAGAAIRTFSDLDEGAARSRLAVFVMHVRGAVKLTRGRANRHLIVAGRATNSRE